MSCKCNNKPYDTQYIGDVQVDNLSTLPEYLLAERDVEDEISEHIVRSLVRVQTDKIIPDPLKARTFKLADPDGNITVPAGQVRFASMHNDGGTVVPRYEHEADAPYAQFLVIGKDGEEVICQRDGVIVFPEGHGYTALGQQYYAGGDEGEPTTDSDSHFALFVPFSSTELLVNMGYVDF